MKPYGLVADVHLHEWSAFSSVVDGVNSRLRIILNELTRCAKEVIKQGGDTLIIAGDIFHVRGSLSPRVLNPALDTFREIIGKGVRVYALAGNHDLANRESDWVGSAVSALDLTGVSVINQQKGWLARLDDDGYVRLIPWHSTVAGLKATLESIKPTHDTDLIIHAPVDGVIDGLPSHGLTADWLSGLGYRRVFSGHYHNHKNLTKNVWSIGALTHQTWGDVGNEAGFMIVTPDGPLHFPTKAPRFVDLTDMDQMSKVTGNYVRLRASIKDAKERADLRQQLLDAGALDAIVVPMVKQSAATQRTATTPAGASMSTFIGDFIREKHPDPAHQTKLTELCLNFLTEV